MQALYAHRLSGATGSSLEKEFLAIHAADVFDKPYFLRLLRGILEREDEMVARLNAVFSDWTADETDPVEHGILLIAAYELLHCLDVPVRVVLNEAVELAKTFGAAESYRFVNGVVDLLAKQVRREETHS